MESVGQSLRLKIERFTYPRVPVPPTDVVLVPEGGSLARGAELARALSGDGRTVRLIGHGAMVAARDGNPFAGTELGALVVGTLGESTRPIRDAIRGHLARIAIGTSMEGALGESLYAEICTRIFQPFIYAYPTCHALSLAFPTAVIHVADERWVGLDLLTALVTANGGSVRSKASGARTLYRRLTAKLAPLAGAGFLLASVALLVSERARSRHSLRALARRASSSEPIKWVGLISDWERMNASVVESIALPALARGEPLGVLLMGTLQRGSRSEQTLKRSGTELWPGLLALRERVDELRVEQVVFPARPTKFVTSLLAGIRTSARLLGRSRGDVPLTIGNVDVSLPVPVAAQSRFLTLDVLRARLGADAVVSLAGRVRLSDADVVLAANVGAVDSQLQQLGACTYHLFHGALGDDWVGGAEHDCTYHLAWTENDARCLASIRGRVAVMGMPRRITPTPRLRGRPTVLLLTSYLHRDYSGVRDFSAFEDEVLRVVTIVRAASPETRFLWRPHPASQNDAVETRRAAIGRDVLERSSGGSLQLDVARADIIVTNMSTVFAECLFADVPVLLHVMPQHWGSAASDFVHADRQFFEAEEGAQKLLSCLSELLSGSIDAAPEAFARTSLWGPSGAPALLDLDSAQFRARPPTLSQ